MTVLFVMVVVASRNVSHVEDLRAPTLAAEHGGCVVDENWNEVLHAFNHHTCLHSVHNWLVFFACLLGLLLVGGVGAFMIGSKKLAGQYELI